MESKNNTTAVVSRDAYLSLVKIANYHSDLYYNQDAPEMTDYEYDRLTGQLKVMEKEHPEWISPESPTQRVGGIAVMSGRKVTHKICLMSLNDVFDLESVDEWYQGIGYAETSVQEKIDGLTVALEYRNGVLYQGATRGDGVTGEDVTENTKVVSGIPQKLNIPKEANVSAVNRLFVRAEVYMPVMDFERVNTEVKAAGKR